jgi:hypothetical protein
MTFSIFATAARRAVLSTLTALILAAAVPQAGFAQGTSAAGIWKVDPVKSSFNSGHATLALDRTGAVNQSAGSFIVVSKGNVYLVTGATASGGIGVRPAAYTLKTGRQAVMIGTNARSAEPCGPRCIQGYPDTRMTLTFNAVGAAGQQINDMIAYSGRKQ